MIDMGIRITSASALTRYRNKLLGEQKDTRKVLAVCTSGCVAYGAKTLADAFDKEIAKRRLGKKVVLKRTGCHGFCERGPLVVVHPGEIFYQRVRPEDIPEILEKTIVKGKRIDRLLYKDADGRLIEKESQVPFYANQKRLLLAHNSRIDPTRIDDYIGLGGYRAAARILGKTEPEEVIDEILA